MTEFIKKTTIGLFLLVVFFIPQQSLAQDDKNVADHVSASLLYVGDKTPPKLRNFFSDVLEPFRTKKLEKVSISEEKIKSVLNDNYDASIARPVDKGERLIRNIYRIFLIIGVFIFSSQILFYPLAIVVMVYGIKIIYKIIRRILNRNKNHG